MIRNARPLTCLWARQEEHQWVKVNNNINQIILKNTYWNHYTFMPLFLNLFLIRGTLSWFFTMWRHPYTQFISFFMTSLEIKHINNQFTFFEVSLKLQLKLLTK